MKSPSEIASEIIQLGIGYAVGTKTFDDFEGSIIQAITVERQRQERLVAALADISGLHSKCSSCAITSGDDECVTYQIAQQVLKEVK